MNRRRVTQRLGLLLLGLGFGLVLAEGAARFIAPDAAADLLFDAPGNVPKGMYVADPELSHSPNPGFTGTLRYLGYAVPIRFNALALRGPEPGPRVPSHPRWLMLGDSFTLAAQVPEAETFSGRLAAAGIEAWNAGVDGYSTWHARTRYRRVADALQPDGVVLIYFLGNDPQDDTRFERGIRMNKGFAPGEPLPALTGNPLSSFVARNSYLYGHVHVALRRQAVGRGTAPETRRWADELDAFTPGGKQRLEAQLQRSSAKALRALQEEARTRGDRMIVAVAPPAFEIIPARREATFALVGIKPEQVDVDQPARAVGALLTQLGIAQCDLVEPLRSAQSKGRTLYFTYDGHWTADGHAVVADAIRACIQAGGGA